jgi:hypothetical protein
VAFYFSVIFVPLLVIIIGAVARYFHQMPQTTASDLLAFLIILDATIIIDAGKISRIIANPDASQELAAIGLLSIILNVSIWHFCLLKVEPELLRAHRLGSRGRFPWKMWLFATTSVMILLVLHVALLTGRIL